MRAILDTTWARGLIVPFLVLFFLLAVGTLWHNRRGSTPSRYLPAAALGLQTALFLLAVYYAARLGAFSRDLASPGYILLGLLLGHLLFAISLLVTHNVWRDAIVHFFDLGGFVRFLAETPTLIGRFIAVSFAEELIYRVAAQPLLVTLTGQAWLAILLVAAVFSIVHKHFFENELLQSVEFAGFSIVLGVLYHCFGSLSLVLVVHTVRNLESVFLEYLLKAGELGDEALALAELEQAYMKKSV